MAFLDEDEPLARPGGGGPPSRRTSDRQRQIMVRRAVGVGALVVILILLVLGIRGCLNARTHRSYENYASDLTAIATQSNQLSRNFFDRLSNPGNLSPLAFEAQVAADRGAAEGLDTRVHALDTPGNLGDAQNKLNLAFDLRLDALTGISNQMKTALGNPGPQRTAAVNSIANYMQYFLASDVLYSLAQGQINAALSDQGISQKVPDSVFMTDPNRWLDSLEVSSALASVSSKATSGTHGLALLQTTIKPGNQTLDPNTPATVTGPGTPEVDVQVQNQGSVEESNVGVSLQLTGGTQTITGSATVPRIAAGSIQTASIPIQPAPEKNRQLTLEVTVEPVPGEQIVNNNRQTYTVTFK